MTPDSCPNSEDLRKFVRCSVTEAEADDISAHLEQCPVCEETVVGLERDGDTVADHFRKAVAEQTFAHEPEYQQLLQSLLDGTAKSVAGSKADATDLAVDQSLRDYQIVAKVGEGGMGAVYKAIHQRLKKTVALKVLPTNRIGDGPAVARFEREMSVLGQLNHPHIVQALDAGEHDGQHYLVMEYVAGSDLGEIVRRSGPLPIADACQVISQAALGLQYAHEHGFVHRDIKPANLMLAMTGQRTGPSQALVKILDLGLARAFEQLTDHSPAKADLTTPGQVMGTLDYMAPEQGGDSHQVDIRADIYSLGATLYKLLTGESPYAEHTQKPPLQRLMAIAQQEPPSIRSKRADIPEKLATIVHRMLAKRPEHRFATPAEVVQALEPFCAGADLAALLIPQGATRVLDAQLESAPLLSPGAAGDRTGRHWRTVWAGFGAFLFLAAILLITTRHGTVEVASPDGKLPDDVTVVISKGSEEIEFLQADNHWSARVVNGAYHVELRGGDDRFEIKNSQLIVNRMGQAAVTVTLKPAAEEPRPEVAAKKPNSTQPHERPPTDRAPAPAPADQANPIVIVRAGSDIRSFKTLAGAIDELEADDVVEIRTNDRLPVILTEIVTRPLHLRAGTGFRPTLAVIGGPQTSSASAQVACFDADLTCERLDLDVRQTRMWSNSSSDPSAKAHWRFARCRWWGALPAGPARVAMSDCIIDATDGFSHWTGDSEVALANCAIRHNHYLLTPQGGGHHRLVMRNCTYLTVDFGSPLFARIEDHSTLAVEATGNLFHAISQAEIPIVAPMPQQVTWTGAHNCYSGIWYRVHEQQPDQSYVVKEEGIAGWNKLWAAPEQESRDASVAFELGRSQQGSMVDAVPWIREQVQSRLAHHELSAGPNWDLVGTGEAYLKSLRESGVEIEADALRPERLDGGPIVILRNGQALAGYASLQAAVDAAQDEDVLEIRTDRPIEGVQLAGNNRLLAIRSAPGYAPVVDGNLVSVSDRLILEGVTVRQQVSAVSPGAIVALRNCIVEGTFPPFSVASDGTGESEVVNCALHYLQIKLDGQDTIRVRNSVVGQIFVIGNSDEGLKPRIEIDQTACFAPMPLTKGDVYSVQLQPSRPIAIHATGSVFVSPRNLVHGSGQGFSWTGSGNVFAKPYEFFNSRSTLSDVQAQFSTEVDSVELSPWEFDPAQWRINRESSIDYQPRADGTDYGVDIDHLIEALHSQAEHESAPTPQ